MVRPIIATQFAVMALLFSVPHIVRAQSDTYPVKFNIGIVEGWRAAPEAISRWCEKVDPDGISERKASYNLWLSKYDEIIKQIAKNVEAVVPVITPNQNAQVNVVEAVRAKIFIEVLKNKFLGKSDEEAKSICKGYSPEPSSSEMQKVSKALGELEKWRGENNVVFK